MPKRSRLPQLRRLRLRRENPSRAPLSQRQIAHGAALSLPQRPRRSRAFWLLTPLFLIVLLFCSWRFVVVPRIVLNLDEIVRAQILPQIQSQIGAKVEIGRIETDYSSRVTLHNVVIGRGARSSSGAKLPFGALARAPRIDLTLDIVALAFKRADATRALRKVVIQAPQLYLERDARGLNWSRLLKSSSSTGSRTQALFQIQNAQVFLLDKTLRDRRGKALQARAQSVDATIQTQGDEPLSFQISAPQTRIGAHVFANAGVFYVLNKIALKGDAAADFAWFSSRFDLPSLSVALPIEYSNEVQTALGKVVRGSGEIAARGQVAWQRPPSGKSVFSTLLWTSELRARGVGLQMSGKWPRTNRNIALSNANGILKIVGRTVQTSDFRLNALETPLHLAGSFALNENFGPDAMEITARSSRVDVARLWPILSKDARDATLRGTVLRGLAQGAIRFKGTPENLQIGGEISALALNFRYRDALLQTAQLRATFQTDATLRRGTARFSLQNVVAQGELKGAPNADRVLVKTFGATQGAATWERDASGVLRAVDVSLDAPRFTVGARELNAAAQSAKARIAWREGDVTANWQARDVSGQSRRADFAGDARSSLLDGDFFQVADKSTLRFASKGAAFQAPRWGNGRANDARGEISWRTLARGNAISTTPLKANIALQNVVAQPSALLQSQMLTSTRSSSPQTSSPQKTLQVRAQSLRLLLATTDALAPRAIWNGAATFTRLDANALRAALPISLAARVRSLGELNGRARFYNLGGSTPVGSGDFLLSRAVVDDLAVRGLRGRIALDGDVVSLRNASAQSEIGTLLLDAQFNRRNGIGSLDLSARDVIIGSARINPLLASSGVSFEGQARGTLRLSSSDLALQNGAPIRVRFDLRLPRAQLASSTRNGDRVLAGDNVQLENARLKGEGTLRRADDNSWTADGSAQIEAANARLAGASARSMRDFRVGRWSFPAWTRGANLQNIAFALQGRVALGGEVEHVALLPQIAPSQIAPSQIAPSQIAPSQIGQSQIAKRAQTLALPTQIISSDLRGRLRVANLILPMRNMRVRNEMTSGVFASSAFASGEIALVNLDAPLSWKSDRNGGNVLQMPRISAQIPQLGRIEYSKGRRIERAAIFEAQISMRQTPNRNSQGGALKNALQWSGEALARDIDAARLQRLGDVVWRAIQKTDQPLFGNAALRGTAFVRAQLTSQNRAPRLDVQARLYRGAVALPQTSTRLSSTRLVKTSRNVSSRIAPPQIVPIEAALARFSYAPQNQAARVDELTLWSRGARLSATGNVSSLTGKTQPLDFDVQLNNVRVRDLQNVLQIKTPSTVDGVLSGVFQIAGTTQTPRAVGRATLRLARFGEVAVDEANAQVRWENAPTGTRLALSEIVARLDKTTLGGDAIADTRRNIWRANLSMERAPAAQLLRAVEALSVPTKNGAAKSAAAIWPLRGDVRAAVRLSGDFAAKSLARARVLDAQVEMNADALRWRGRELGAMNANFSLRDNVLRIEDAALTRQLSAAEIAQLRQQKLVIVAPDVAPSGEVSNATSSTRSSGVAKNSAANDGEITNVFSAVTQVRVSGEIPLSGATATPLQVGVRIENERFSVLRDVLMEVQRTLRERGQNWQTLDSFASSTRSLPAGLEARVTATAKISGEIKNPRVALEAVVEGAQLDAQELPALETSLVFANGAIEVNNLEIKQTFNESDERGKPERVRETAVRETAVRETAVRETAVRETTLRVASGGRVVPGGEISLDVEVLRANLSQLAQWVPFLRGADGAPILRGELSLFSFEVRGETASPQVTGSVEARDVSANGIMFDRLRVTTFAIKDDVLRIEPGNFTVVKGGFQSSAAYGSVPWSWGGNGRVMGPGRDGVLDIHLPLQTRDFGALSGAFIPALTDVTAGEFKGSVDITGTLDNPQLAGALSFKDARFRVDPAVGPFPFGIDKMSGGVRFVDGNRVLVEDLRGVIERADEVRATSTGNPSASQRDARAALREASAQRRGVNAPNIAGDFGLNGEIELDLDPRVFDARRAQSSGSRLASHRYNLAMTFQNGAIFSPTYSGLRDISMQANWKTGDGDPRRAQNVTWTIKARGRNTLSRTLGRQALGTISSTGSARLAPNFASSVDALLRSNFQGEIITKALPFQMRDVGRMVVDGNLKLDNGNTTRERVSPLTPRVRVNAEIASVKTNAAPVSPLKIQSAIIQSAIESNGAPKTAPRPTSSTRLANGTTVIPMPSRSFAELIEKPRTSQNSATPDDFANDNLASDNLGYEITPRRKTPASDARKNGAATGAEIGGEATDATAGATRDSDNLPLRIAGDMVLSQTEVTGLPTSEGVSVSPLLFAPFFDINLKLGRDVRFTTSTLRAELSGELDLTGTPRQPRLLGTVTTRNGQMRFPSATARIEQGEISIDVSRDSLTQSLRSRATIDALARGQVGRYQITIVLRGPLDLGGNGIATSNDAANNGQNLRVDVTSNPPLSQDEAFAQLTGTSLRETTGETNQAYARAVVNLLSAPLFSGLERTLEETFGLNSFTLDYRLNEPVGVQLGKAIGDRVFVTYRRSLTRGSLSQPAYSLRVDFRVKGGVQIGAQIDERGRQRLTIEKTLRF